MAGPVGLFCTSLAEHKATTDSNLVIESWPTLRFHLLHSPLQHLKAFFDTIACDSHAAFLTTNRTAMANLHTMDKLVYKEATRGLPYQQRQALLATQTLGTWDSAKQKEHYFEGDSLCPWCKLAPGGALHEAWQCVALKGIQQEVDPDLMHLSLENTPPHILLGIPLQLPADHNWDFFIEINLYDFLPTYAATRNQTHLVKEPLFKMLY